MVLGMTLIRRVVLLGAFTLGTFAAITRQAAAQTPSPALLVVNRGTGDHSLAIVDPMTNKVVGRVPITGGGYPHEVAVSHDGQFAYVTNTSFDDSQPLENPTGIQDDFIAVIDLTTQKTVRHIKTGIGSGPHNIVQTGGKLYFTCEGYRTVARYDPVSDQIDWVFGTGQSRTHMVVVTKDLSKVFTANTASDTITAIEQKLKPPPTEQLVGNFRTTEHLGGNSHDKWDLIQIPVTHGPEGIALSPDEKEIWALTRWDGFLSIIDVASHKLTETINLKAYTPMRLAFTPDGKRVLIADNYDGQLLVLDAVSRKEIKRLKLESKQTAAELKALQDRAQVRLSLDLMHQVMITPDGSHAYASVMGSNYVAIIDMKTLQFTGRISTGSRPEGLVWVERK
jgi:YVTN family beta-propeller protein